MWQVECSVNGRQNKVTDSFAGNTPGKQYGNA
jgi:hypothetical protein